MRSRACSNGDVEEDHRHRLVAEAPRGDQALVAADDGLVLAAGQHRLDEAVLLQAPGQRFELGVGDAPRVRRVGPQLVDGDLDRPRGPLGVVASSRDPFFA